MEWEKKTEMVRLGNSGDQQKLAEFAMENFKEFDEQAWCMFLDCVDLLRENIGSNLKIHQTLYEVLKPMQFGSFRVCIRAATYEGIVSELTEKQSEKSY